MAPARTNIQRHLQAALLLTSSLLLMTCPAGGEMCTYDFSGPVDAVFVIDRSESVGIENVGKVKDLVRSIVLKKIPTGPTADAKFSRLAVVTVTGSATVNLDLITDTRELYNCELFAPGGLFDRQVPSTVEKDGGKNGIGAAIRNARDLFNKRPAVRKKVLFLSSDFHDIDANTIREYLSQLRTAITRIKNVTLMTYGIGVGAHYENDSMLEIFDHDNCSARHLDEWKPYGQGEGPSDGMPHPITDPALCCHLCTNTTTCSCHEHDDLAVRILRPECDPIDDMCRVMTTTPPTTTGASTPSTSTGAGTPPFKPTIAVTTQAGVAKPKAGTYPTFIWPLLLACVVFLGVVVVSLAILAAVLHGRRMRQRRPPAQGDDTSTVAEIALRDNGPRSKQQKPKGLSALRRHHRRHQDKSQASQESQNRYTAEPIARDIYSVPDMENADDSGRDAFGSAGRDLPATRRAPPDPPTDNTGQDRDYVNRDAWVGDWRDGQDRDYVNRDAWVGDWREEAVYNNDPEPEPEPPEVPANVPGPRPQPPALPQKPKKSPKTSLGGTLARSQLASLLSAQLAKFHKSNK